MRRAWKEHPPAVIGVAISSLLVMLAVFAPWIAPQDPANIDLAARLQAPSAHHLLGNDELGRDILSRVIFGARVSMLVGVGVVATSLLVGLIMGSLAGYFGGTLDRFFNIVLMNAFISTMLKKRSSVPPK